MRIHIFCLIGILSISGCAGYEAAQAALAEKRTRYYETIPQCSNQRDCDRMWAAANAWVSRNAGWKIQTASDNLIETFNPVGQSSSLAVRVTREPIGTGDSYRILIEAYCSNAWGVCDPDVDEAKLDFNSAVSAVVSGSSGQAGSI